ncbi:MAG: hypothetical protein K6E96_05920 [Bacteroidales bacterium]|nr:hypothetical protein [Bacteroidales bacterium]
MKKIFSILMVAFAMTMMVACGDEGNTNNNDNPTPSGDATSTVPAGMYSYSECTSPDDEDHVCTSSCGYCWILSVTNGEPQTMLYYFQKPNFYVDEEDDTERDFGGSYTYSATASSGSVDFNEMTPGGYSGTGHFTYDDEHKAIVMTFLDMTVTMTQDAAW